MDNASRAQWKGNTYQMSSRGDTIEEEDRNISFYSSGSLDIRLSRKRAIIMMQLDMHWILCTMNQSKFMRYAAASRIQTLVHMDIVGSFPSFFLSKCHGVEEKGDMLHSVSVRKMIT